MRIVVGSRGHGARPGSALAEVLLAESSQPLLLGHHVDVGTDREGDNVEEDHPSRLGEELLSEGEAERGADPRNFHDLPEADTNGGADLVVGPGASNQGHGDEVDRVLDGGDLEHKNSSVSGGSCLVKAKIWGLGNVQSGY